MATPLKPYPAYKPAGVPWLQQVPEHWDMLPNRGLVRKRKVLVGKRHKEYQLLSLTKQGIIVRDLSTGKGKFSADMGTSQEVRKGDLVFCLFDVPETPRTVGLSSHDGMITGAYTVFETIGNGSAEYFDYYYRAMDDRKMLGPLYSGLRNTIPLDRLLVAKTPQPPPDEQHLIVRYLHALDAKVKRYIRTKRTLIARLQEQKQAIIQRAVTRGLDPERSPGAPSGVKLKPSGVEWLGEVPEHWEVKKLKYVISEPLRYGANEAAEHTRTDWPRYIRITDFGYDGALRPETFRSLKPEIAQDYLVSAGDLLFARSGATVGKAFLVRSLTGEACHAGYLIRARPDQSIVLPEFLYTYTQTGAFNEWKELTFNTATIQNIGADKYATLSVPVPSIEEQRRILQWLNETLTPVNRAIGIAQREIQTLLEYHTRLIADVVTGAVDVTAAAKAMAVEAEEVMEEEPLSMAAEGEAEYGEDTEL
ncbi:MAG TPA: restriction endonuclease subunit S [Flavobacteriales bacterium]|nr:restriction endonuclease subunit S [Flavobacteriales bacterium]